VSPRPRLATDNDILAAVFRAVARHGPANLTLADVAKEVGLSPAALVQRFGSKRELLLAAAADAASGHAFLFTGLRERHSSPAAAVLGLAECMTILGTTRAQVANSLAFFQSDLTDAEFQRHARTGAHTFHTGIRSLLRDAISAGELKKCDTEALARALHATLWGSVLGWVIDGEGELASWIAADLKTVLKGYR
jgi:AcrR family transcriptional regulator